MNTKQHVQAGLVLGALLLAGCKGLGTEETQNPANWPQLTSAVTQDPAIEARIDQIMATMSLEHKVGQLIQPELRTVTPDEIREYHIGSVLNGGGSFPDGNKHAKVSDWVALADQYYEASMDTSDGGPAIPIMWGTDAVHGHSNVIGATIFPHNIALGAANNPELIRKIHEATAREVAATGIDWTFSPSVAVARDDRWGRTYESYAEYPDRVYRFAGEAVLGLQGDVSDGTFMGPGRIIATAKHFIGDGGTVGGVDRGETPDSERELVRVHAPGYFSSIEAGTQTIMASFNSWQGEKLHGHHYLMTEVLKNRMGFDGLIVGDWNGHEFVDGCTRNSCPQAINAGLDIFMAPDDWQQLYANTLAQVRSGEIPPARLDDAVRRILRVKLRAGLFEKGAPSTRAYAGQAELLGAPEHRAVARQAVRESLVLLKNQDGLLPLSRNSRVLLAGDGANNIGKQSGGWTISWQGTGNTNDDFPDGTSIYQGIADIVGAAGGQVELSETGDYTQKPDVAIVVFGEEPYAEMQGDVSHLAYQDDTHLGLLKRLQGEGIPVVALFVTGRPLWVNPFLNSTDAFVVIWQPGSEGHGVADVVFRNANGGINHDFKGTLSFSWPNTAVQTPLNRDQANGKPLFPYGYGLTYAKRSSLDTLSEESGISAADGTQSLAIFRDRPMDPWQLVIGDLSRRALPVTGSGASLPGIELQSVDRYVQEDSRRVSWTGANEAQVSFVSTARTDLTPYAAQQGALVFDVRVEQAPNGPVSLGMDCGQDCVGQRDISPLLQQLPQGEWQTVSVDLTCLAGEGVDLSMVLAPFYLSSADTLGLTLHHIRVEPVEAPTLDCSDSL